MGCIAWLILAFSLTAVVVSTDVSCYTCTDCDVSDTPENTSKDMYENGVACWNTTQYDSETGRTHLEQARGKMDVHPPFIGCKRQRNTETCYCSTPFCNIGVEEAKPASSVDVCICNNSPCNGASIISASIFTTLPIFAMIKVV